MQKFNLIYVRFLFQKSNHDRLTIADYLITNTRQTWYPTCLRRNHGKKGNNSKAISKSVKRNVKEPTNGILGGCLDMRNKETQRIASTERKNPQHRNIKGKNNKHLLFSALSWVLCFSFSFSFSSIHGTCSFTSTCTFKLFLGFFKIKFKKK